MFHQFLSLSRSLSLSIAFLRKVFKAENENIMHTCDKMFIFSFSHDCDLNKIEFIASCGTMMSRHQQYTSHAHSGKNMKMCWKSKNILRKIMVNLFLFQSLLATMCVCVCVFVGCRYAWWILVSFTIPFAVDSKQTHRIWWEFIRNVHACLQAAYFLCVFCVGFVAYNSIHFGTYTHPLPHTQTHKCVRQIQPARMCFMCASVYPC